MKVTKLQADASGNVAVTGVKPGATVVVVEIEGAISSCAVQSPMNLAGGKKRVVLDLDEVISPAAPQSQPVQSQPAAPAEKPAAPGTPVNLPNAKPQGE